MFAAAGTAGQRCTTLRRLVLHEKIYDEFLGRLKRAYAQLKPGDPLMKVNRLISLIVFALFQRTPLHPKYSIPNLALMAAVRVLTFETPPFSLGPWLPGHTARSVTYSRSCQGV